MYKIIKLKTLSDWPMENYVIFKCEVSEAIEIMDVIESMYTTAKLLNYRIFISTFKTDNFPPRIVIKFVNENKTIIADLFTDSEFLIQDLILNNGEGEEFYSYTQAKRDTIVDNKVIEDFNHSTESIPNKFRKLLGLL